MALIRRRYGEKEREKDNFDMFYETNMSLARFLLAINGNENLNEKLNFKAEDITTATIGKEISSVAETANIWCRFLFPAMFGVSVAIAYLFYV